MTVASVSQNSLQVNMVSPVKETLNQALTCIPPVLIDLIGDYVVDNIVTLFLKTIALPYIKDPFIAKSVTDDALWYGKSVTKVDLSRTSVSFYHGEAPYPQNWFQTRVDDVLHRFFPNVREFITPAAGCVTTWENDGAYGSRHEVSLQQYKRTGLTILQPKDTQFIILTLTATENNPAYDCVISQRDKLDPHMTHHHIKIITFATAKSDVTFTAEMKELENSFVTQLTEANNLLRAQLTEARELRNSLAQLKSLIAQVATCSINSSAG